MSRWGRAAGRLVSACGLCALVLAPTFVDSFMVRGEGVLRACALRTTRNSFPCFPTGHRTHPPRSAGTCTMQLPDTQEPPAREGYELVRGGAPSVVTGPLSPAQVGRCR
jgi:hypothetical protein